MGLCFGFGEAYFKSSMIVYIAADHRGFKLKEYLTGILRNEGYEVADLGNRTLDPNDDFVDFAAAVGRKISIEYQRARGIVICGSGVGADVVANKFPNVRSAIGFSPDQVYDGRHDDDFNVLALAANFLEPEQAKKIVLTWLTTEFAGEERYKRRLDKISRLETRQLWPVEDEN